MADQTVRLKAAKKDDMMVEMWVAKKVYQWVLLKVVMKVDYSAKQSAVPMAGLMDISLVVHWVDTSAEHLAALKAVL